MKFISILVGVTTSRPTVILVHVLFFFKFSEWYCYNEGEGTVIRNHRVCIFKCIFIHIVFFNKMRLGVEADIDIYIYIVLLMKQFLL